jgi:hypothetical protein
VPEATQEQSQFSTEGQMAHSIALPPAIRTQMEKDPFVRESMAAEDPPLSSLPEGWTECSIIHLKNSDETDYVVVGQHSLTGAHATHFWVYRTISSGVRLVLFAFADSLEVEPRKFNQLRSITTSYYTAVSDGPIHYSFDGKQYRTKHAPQYR